jgi:hypothetical protein
MYPAMKKAVINAIDKRIQQGNHFEYLDNAEDIFNWWISGKSVKNYIGNKGQLTFNLDVEK